MPPGERTTTKDEDYDEEAQGEESHPLFSLSVLSFLATWRSAKLGRSLARRPEGPFLDLRHCLAAANLPFCDYAYTVRSEVSPSCLPALRELGGRNILPGAHVWD